MALLERLLEKIPLFTCEKQVTAAVDSVLRNAQQLRYEIAIQTYEKIQNSKSA